MTIPSIDIGGFSPVVLDLDPTSTPVTAASNGVASFLAAMSHPLAENAALQSALSACVVSLEKASQSVTEATPVPSNSPTPTAGADAPSPVTSSEHLPAETVQAHPAVTEVPNQVETVRCHLVDSAVPHQKVDAVVAEPAAPAVAEKVFECPEVKVASPVSAETVRPVANQILTAERPVEPAVGTKEFVAPPVVGSPSAPIAVVKAPVAAVVVNETAAPVRINDPAAAAVVGEPVVTVAANESVAPAIVNNFVAPVAGNEPVAPVVVGDTVAPVVVKKEVAQVAVPGVVESYRPVVAPEDGTAVPANTVVPPNIHEAADSVMPGQERPRLQVANETATVARDPVVVNTPADGGDSVSVDAEKLVAAGFTPAVQSQQVVVPASDMGVAEVAVVAARTVENVDRVQRVMSASEVLVETARVVADTILVTPGLLRGQGEVRIQLRPDVLDGTEVRIVAAGRHLEVEFIPTVQNAAAMIEQCRPQLEQHLAERIHAFAIAVRVNPNVTAPRVGRARRNDEEVA